MGLTRRHYWERISKNDPRLVLGWEKAGRVELPYGLQFAINSGFKDSKVTVTLPAYLWNEAGWFDQSFTFPAQRKPALAKILRTSKSFNDWCERILMYCNKNGKMVK